MKHLLGAFSKFQVDSEFSVQCLKQTVFFIHYAGTPHPRPAFPEGASVPECWWNSAGAGAEGTLSSSGSCSPGGQVRVQVSPPNKGTAEGFLLQPGQGRQRMGLCRNGEPQILGVPCLSSAEHKNRGSVEKQNPNAGNILFEHC